MLDKEALHKLLGLNFEKASPEVIIYSDKNSERLNYACHFIFNHVLKLNYSITADDQVLSDSKAFKINYSDKINKDVFTVIPGKLLFEKGITDLRPFPAIEDEMLYLYYNREGDLSFDVFSAVFYMISRYEEWQPFNPDRHQRFEASSSLLYQNKFHLKPVVDIWIKQLGEALAKFYPTLKFPEKEFKIMSTIDVDNLYAYKFKGLKRTLGATAKDFIKLDLKNAYQRVLVLSGIKKDPFDIYESVSDFCIKNKIPLIYFFLFKTGTEYDRTVNPNSPAFADAFKTIKENHAYMGLHPSYHSAFKKRMMEAEVKDLALKSKEKIQFSRQHFLRFNIHSTPELLHENGIEADFTMGFASAPGFRAGTSHPFYYYNFGIEKQSPLLLVPFCVMDGAYTVYKKISAETAYEEMLTLAKEVKKVNGLFISVFHERSFSDHLYKGFGTLYKKLHSALKEF